jgi:hypothetical protein
MIDHDKNLETVLEARKALATELSELQAALEQKREMFFKYSGIVEYLSSIQKSEKSSDESVDILEE